MIHYGLNKGRRPWKRGNKLRYSVYKNEERLEEEQDAKEGVERIVKARGLDINMFLANDAHPKKMWSATYERLSSFLHFTDAKVTSRQLAVAIVKDLINAEVIHPDYFKRAVELGRERIAACKIDKSY